MDNTIHIEVTILGGELVYRLYQWMDIDDADTDEVIGKHKIFIDGIFSSLIETIEAKEYFEDEM